jgi:hypothetical protein
MSDFADFYKKQGLSRVVVISREETKKSTGVEDEHTYESIVALRGATYVKIFAHLRTQFMPSGRRFKILAEKRITEAEYHKLARQFHHSS